MESKHLILAAALTGTFGLATAAEAASLGISDTAPTTNIIDSHFADNNDFTGFRWPDGDANKHKHGGQTFVVPTGETWSVQAITVNFSSVGEEFDNKPIFVEIWDVGSDTNNPSLTNLSQLAFLSDTVNLPATAMDLEGKYVTFNFDETATLTAGNYGFLWGLDDPTSDDPEISFRAGRDGGQNIAGTTAWNKNGDGSSSAYGTLGTGTDNGDNKRDLEYYIHVPEPASVALLGLGGLAMLGRRRRASA
ncbi:MAG: PEP-CTERM sorting domain-containing protein [Phycisphaeraceae bacterium]